MTFYHAMHYSAERDIEIACRLSVRPSVTLVDQDHIHVGLKFWKLIARTISPTPSLFVAQRTYPPTPGEHGEIWGRVGRLEVGWKKVACWSTKAPISLKRVKTEEKLLWRAYRKSQTLFQTIPSPTSNGVLFPKNWGFSTPNSGVSDIGLRLRQF